MANTPGAARQHSMADRQPHQQGPSEARLRSDEEEAGLRGRWRTSQRRTWYISMEDPSTHDGLPGKDP